MDILHNLIGGFQVALTPTNLMFCFLGVLLGTLIGALPGLGTLTAISMLLPVTYYLEPTTALIMLAGIYYGGEYGGSISSILLNLPGTPSSAATCLDGHPMARQGRAGVALFMTAIASFVGGTVGLIALVLFAPSIAAIGLTFSPAAYFALMALGLTAAATITAGSALKGLMMVVMGLLLGSIGTDINSGVFRYTFGIIDLRDGISLVALAMGLFGVAEVIGAINSGGQRGVATRISLRSLLPERAEVRASVMPVARGSAIGGFLGALPGTGPAIAAFMAYAVEKRVARDPSRFGNGAIEGVMAPEAANNCAAQTSFIPTLTIGIPGSATMAIMLGALMIHGIAPGPFLVTDHPMVFWGLVASFWIGNLMLLVLNIPLIGIWVRVLRIPYKLLYPIILSLICIGVYSLRNSGFDVVMVLVFGFAGYLLQRAHYPPAPLLLGFVLGPMMEEKLRRAMLLARGDPVRMVSDPLVASLLALTAAIILWAVVSGLRGMLRARRVAAT